MITKKKKSITKSEHIKWIRYKREIKDIKIKTDVSESMPININNIVGLFLNILLYFEIYNQ